MSTKKLKGQFYTVNSTYILDGLSLDTKNASRIVEPFAGKGDLVNCIATKKLPLEMYDIDPKRDGVVQRDTLLNPPDYTGAWILTNPPYLARNKCEDKKLFDKYNTNDLYKCFLYTIHGCVGGVFIIPAGFFLSPRDLDVKCRHDFMSKYRITRVKYFEETVFPDTTTTVVAFSFEKSDSVLHEQNVEWVSMPSGQRKIFTMKQDHDWIIGGDVYKLPTCQGVTVRRYVEGQTLRKGEYITSMTLNALDSGKKDGRISLDYKKGYVYPAKECSRTYATLCITGKTLSDDEQHELCRRFNEFLEHKRLETWSLFLPQFRESKEYARKRIPFELAYTLVLHLMQ
jgi:hypothetical protein